MRETKGAGRKVIAALLLVLALLILASAAMAQFGATAYSLFWWTVDGGSGTVRGGSYELSGTVGQPDAGVLASGSYTLSGGFWGGAAGGYAVYLPVVVKGYQ